MYYTCPDERIAMVNALFAVCTSDAEPSAFDCRVNDAFVARNQALPVANPFELTEDQPITLHAGQTLKLRRAGEGPCDIVMSVIEQVTTT